MIGMTFVKMGYIQIDEVYDTILFPIFITSSFFRSSITLAEVV